MSDYDAVKSLTIQGYSMDAHDAAVRAVNAGVQMEMSSHNFLTELTSALRRGEVKQSTIDNAVRNILVL